MTFVCCSLCVSYAVHWHPVYTKLAEPGETELVTRLALSALQTDFGWKAGTFTAHVNVMEGVWWTMDVWRLGTAERPKQYWLFRRRDTSLIMFEPLTKVYLQHGAQQYVMFDHKE